MNDFKPKPCDDLIIKFESFLESLPDNCVVDIRISDNVLDEKDWGVSQLTINDGLVQYQDSITNGVYEIPAMLGWSITDVVEWSQYQEFGSHPEVYHEIKLYPEVEEVIHNALNILGKKEVI